ncbi:hypothetical protein CEV08_03570 [Bartonella tribocorum]|uniref:Uncharacterized protein n=1 Tax=Bartonella tribocorum TaxID=85701 RepID=A0A2M6UWD1_9HYPH|nr:hypothetical protein CEV08_03570 [Bartonella tribocorum]
MGKSSLKTMDHIFKKILNVSKSFLCFIKVQAGIIQAPNVATALWLLRQVHKGYFSPLNFTSHGLFLFNNVQKRIILIDALYTQICPADLTHRFEMSEFDAIWGSSFKLNNAKLSLYKSSTLLISINGIRV